MTEKQIDGRIKTERFAFKTNSEPTAYCITVRGSVILFDVFY